MAISSGLKPSQAHTHRRYTQCMSASVIILQSEIFLNLSATKRKRKLTPGRRLWRWKDSTEKSTRAKWERMKYWSIDPCLDLSCVSFPPCNYDLKCHFPTKLRVASFCLQHAEFLFSVYLSLNLPPLRSRLLLSPSHIYHLRLSRWEEKQEQEDERKRQKTAFIIRKIGFQATDLYLPREHTNGKMPSKFPACWSVNQLIREQQYHGELSVFLGRRAQTTAALASSCKLFLPINL